MAQHVFSLDDIRLAKRLGVLDALIKQGVCTHCGWPTHGTYHRENCGRARRAKRAPVAPAQPWESKAA